ncbi:MAG: DUF4145 domain-containing protein [Anaerolinea sp.]|nr:DUF4145 domain-containing protein [Anaerolinea sp.]MCC6976021.1 DUF4145 domain-containing protein [Anaerolineae bacterium]
MLTDLAKSLLQCTHNIQQDLRTLSLPPSDITAAVGNSVLPYGLFKKCRRGYIQKVVHQINHTYTNTCYDACAVMIRRLIETLIIEVFEAHKLDHKIKQSTGEFQYLESLINAAVNESVWNLGRNAKKAMERLKKLGDASAHNRRWNAHREYIDELKDDLRTVSHELIALAKMDN